MIPLLTAISQFDDILSKVICRHSRVARVDSGDTSMNSRGMSSVGSRDMGSIYCGHSYGVVSYSCGWLQSSSMSIVNSSDHSTSSLSMSNLLKSVGFSLPLAIGMNTVWIGRVDTSNMGHCTIGIARVDTGRDSRDSSMDSGDMSSVDSGDSVSYSCGWLQSSSMSIVNSSHHSAIGLSMSNLFESVG